MTRKHTRRKADAKMHSPRKVMAEHDADCKAEQEHMERAAAEKAQADQNAKAQAQAKAQADAGLDWAKRGFLMGKLVGNMETSIEAGRVIAKLNGRLDRAGRKVALMKHAVRTQLEASHALSRALND